MGYRVPKENSRNGVSVSENLANALERLKSAHARFVPSLTPTDKAITIQELTNSETMATAIVASKDIFALEEERHRAQLWLYTFCGDVLTPSVYLMVTTDLIPSLDFETGTLFARETEGYWFGFTPREETQSYEETGRSIAKSFVPIVEAIGELTGIRPAPLWAVIADGVSQPAMGAGNEDFEQIKAMNLTKEILAGIEEEAGINLPNVKFEQVDFGEIRDVDENEEPEYIFTRRVSCCMIYHSPKAGICTSCPHQDKDERAAKIIAAAEMY